MPVIDEIAEHEQNEYSNCTNSEIKESNPSQTDGKLQLQSQTSSKKSQVTPKVSPSQQPPTEVRKARRVCVPCKCTIF